MENTIKAIESLDKTLATVIDGAPEKGAELVDWLYVQVPDVVNQLLLWRAVESGIMALYSLTVAALMAILSYFFGMKFFRFMKSEKEHQGLQCIFPLGVLWTIGLVVVCVNISNFLNNLVWLEIWLAPKVYLLKFLAAHATK